VAVDLAAHHNYLRALAGRGPLRLDGWIQVFAQYHADRLAAGATTCGNLWHSPELATWYAGYAAGENIACLPGCPTDGRRAFELWVHSPPHAANVFHPDYGVLGVGATCNGRVQMVVAHYRTP
jgi:uncharacterized protein YkwD